MAGFGNVNGDIEIYKISDFSCIGKTKLYCGVTLNWSRDSKYLVGAVLSPRVRVDNEYKIFSYNGEEVLGEKFTGEIYECDWINDDNIKYQEYTIEVSQSYLKQKELDKQKKNTTSGINESFKKFEIDNKKGIPGLGKKK